ncbi:MAG: hypothetical protein U5J95_12235 [Balneolaceae bacterium]|nr:hypothetical protein [Balneolaceae bacterium]
MIEVLGFNWWDRSTPKKIKKNVSRIEKQSGSKQAEDHHQIEFTMFDDLITFVTGKYQKWADEKNLTPADLAELLDDCENIEELKEKLSQNREQTSLWEDVFSYYFDDKEAWDNLEKKIQQIVIPIRHKVMHHRLIGIYDVRELEECRDEFNKIIGTAKTKLAQKEFQDAFKAVLNNKLFKIDPDVLKVLNQSLIDPEIFKEFRRSVQIDPEIIQAITKTPLIDPEIMRRFTSGINFRIQGFDNEPTSGEDEGNEEDSNGNEKNDQNEEDKPDDNDKEDKNDSSEDDKNGENDKEGET